MSLDDKECNVMFGKLTTERCQRDRKNVAVRYVIGTLALLCSGAIAQPPRIAVIGDSNPAMVWCALLENNGYRCDNLPDAGPDGPLVDYEVVIPLSSWADPSHLLADFMRAGKGVITFAQGPEILGINTDPIVQAWIGANTFTTGTSQLLTVATDPILGDLPVGTDLLGPNDGAFAGLDDTTGHPGAKVLARYREGTDVIGLMRNDWEGGQSVYLGQPIWPNNPLDNFIILNAVRELAPLPIPTVSHWGLAISTLLLLTAGSVLVRRRWQTAR